MQQRVLASFPPRVVTLERQLPAPGTVNAYRIADYFKNAIYFAAAIGDDLTLQHCPSGWQRINLHPTDDAPGAKLALD